MKAINRLYRYLESKGMNAKAFEALVGVSNGYLAKQRNRNSDLGEGIIMKVLDNCPDLSLTWLLTGDGSMLKNELANEPSGVYRLRTDKIEDSQNIPLYNLEATAGLVDLFQNQGSQTPIDTIHIPNLPKCDGAVFVTGDSMYPLLKSGDIVCYKQIYDFGNEIFWGEMYLISMEVADEEFVSVKYIQKSDKGDKYVKLVSQNQHHQPKDILLKKVRALALIKASIRINSMR